MNNTVAISQPTFLPWLGYLALIQKSDKFVFLDDVFEVTVAETSTTTHTVTVTDQSLINLTDNTVTKKQLVEFSFKFLLGREPNPTTSLHRPFATVE